MGDYELMHYGVKGMKWGVRRYKNPDGSLTSAGQKRISKKYEKSAKKLTKDLSKQYNSLYAKAYNKAANDMNKGEIDKFNAAQRKKYGENYGQREGYIDAYQKLFNGRLTKYMNMELSDFYKNNKNYRKGAELVEKYKMLEWDELARSNNEKINELRRAIANG